MNIQHENNRIYISNEQGQAIAEVTFPPLSKNVVCINHTYVDESLRGGGIASKLLDAVVQDLRRKDLKAVLTCSYAIKWFKQHPEYTDLLYTSQSEE